LQELLLFSEQCRINALRLREGADRRTILNLAIGLHDSRGHRWTYIDAGTQVLAKYQGVVWKGDPMIPELNPVPKAEFAEWANVSGLARDNRLRDPPI
jgi:hypothetical protein